MKNEMEIWLDAISCNEVVARVAVAAFVAHLNPTLEEISDIKTAVSEAVTNSIIHGYGNTFGYRKRCETKEERSKIHPGRVNLSCKLSRGILYIDVEDWGKGIEDVDKAMEPLYTTLPEYDRSGMGFAFMEAFMDDLQVISMPGKGTLVRMQKKLTNGPWISGEE